MHNIIASEVLKVQHMLIFWPVIQCNTSELGNNNLLECCLTEIIDWTDVNELMTIFIVQYIKEYLM